MSKEILLAIEAELKQIRADIAAGNLSKDEAMELLHDIDISKSVVATADILEEKEQLQALLDSTIMIVSALA